MDAEEHEDREKRTIALPPNVILAVKTFAAAHGLNFGQVTEQALRLLLRQNNAPESLTPEELKAMLGVIPSGALRAAEDPPPESPPAPAKKRA